MIRVNKLPITESSSKSGEEESIALLSQLTQQSERRAKKANCHDRINQLIDSSLVVDVRSNQPTQSQQAQEIECEQTRLVRVGTYRRANSGCVVNVRSSANRLHEGKAGHK